MAGRSHPCGSARRGRLTPPADPRRGGTSARMSDSGAGIDPHDNSHYRVGWKRLIERAHDQHRRADCGRGLCTRRQAHRVRRRRGNSRMGRCTRKRLYPPKGKRINTSQARLSAPSRSEENTRGSRHGSRSSYITTGGPPDAARSATCWDDMGWTSRSSSTRYRCSGLLVVTRRPGQACVRSAPRPCQPPSLRGLRRMPRRDGVRFVPR